MVACPFCNVIVAARSRIVGRVACRCGRYEIRNIGRDMLAYTLHFRSGGRSVFHDLELSPGGECFATLPDGRTVRPTDLGQRMQDAIDQERVSDVLDS